MDMSYQVDYVITESQMSSKFGTWAAKKKQLGAQAFKTFADRLLAGTENIKAAVKQMVVDERERLRLLGFDNDEGADTTGE